MKPGEIGLQDSEKAECQQVRGARKNSEPGQEASEEIDANRKCRAWRAVGVVSLDD